MENLSLGITALSLYRRLACHLLKQRRLWEDDRLSATAFRFGGFSFGERRGPPYSPLYFLLIPAAPFWSFGPEKWKVGIETLASKEGFRFHKWTSNDERVLEGVPVEDLECSFLGDPENPRYSLLEIHWASKRHLLPSPSSPHHLFLSPSTTGLCSGKSRRLVGLHDCVILCSIE